MCSVMKIDIFILLILLDGFDVLDINGMPGNWNYILI